MLDPFIYKPQYFAMEEVWDGIHHSSFHDFLARNPATLKKDEQEKLVYEDEKNHMFKREFLSSLNTPGFMSSLSSSPFEALATVAASSSASSLLSTTPCFFHKRVSKDLSLTDADPTVDRRHKRMMKNRESAVRSRARRQAYTRELEREHAELKEENAKLRKQQKMLSVYVPAEVQRKRIHSRSSTAPL